MAHHAASSPPSDNRTEGLDVGAGGAQDRQRAKGRVTRSSDADSKNASSAFHPSNPEISGTTVSAAPTHTSDSQAKRMDGRRRPEAPCRPTCRDMRPIRRGAGRPSPPTRRLRRQGPPEGSAPEPALPHADAKIARLATGHVGFASETVTVPGTFPKGRLGYKIWPMSDRPSSRRWSYTPCLSA